MQDRYKKRFEQLKNSDKKAFIPFTVLGWRDRVTCLETVRSFITCGASALELGLAFSDPVADGPVIQKAAHETIISGFTTDDAFKLLKEIRNLDNSIPIGLLIYYNTALCYGIERFYASARNSGIDSILIADLPPESAAEVIFTARKNSIKQIFIASTLTTDLRLKQISELADAFIYVVSRLGITGSMEQHDAELSSLLEEIKKRTEIPVCVGFGVSSPRKAHEICGMGADGIITGSKIIELIEAQKTGLLPPFSLDAYLRSMVAATSINSRIKEIHHARS